MKGNKCFGLLLLLSIMFGLSLSVSSDTNALKYPISTLSFGSPTYQFRKLNYFDNNQEYYGYFVKNNDLSIYSSRNESFSNGFNFPHTWRFTGSLDESTNSCSIPSFTSGNSDYYTDGVYNASLSGSSSEVYSILDPLYTSNSFGYFDSQNILDPIDSPFDLSIPLYSQLSDSSYFTSDSLCYIQDYDYNTISSSADPFPSIPKFDFSSLTNIPLVNGRLEYLKSDPYVYQFDKLYLSATDQINGVYYTKNGLSMSEIFGVNVPSFSIFTMNLNEFIQSSNFLSPDDSDSSVTERVYSFIIDGFIQFDSDYTLGENAGVILGVDNYYNPYLLSSDNNIESSFSINNHDIYELPSVHSDILCDLSENHSSTSVSDSIYFKCSYNPVLENAFSEEINFRFLNLSLSFNGDSLNSWNYNSFLNTDGDYKFIDFNIITNNDYSDSGWSGSSSGSGGNPGSAPGNINGSYTGGGSGSSSVADYFSSLRDLFNFNIFNPFLPLMNMFSDQSSCANIPIIAGMIHSEETQVCPWFPQSVRQILTPVISLASAMLVFGFFVRWLGASSGNFFEDSRGEVIGAKSSLSNSWGRRGRR